MRAIADLEHQRVRRLAEEELLRKTALLEAQLDATIDGILVVDEQGRKILQNERMLALWHIPPEIAADPDDRAELAFVLNQVTQPEAFLEKVQALYSSRNDTSRDEIERKDGSVLDRYSAPVLDNRATISGVSGPSAISPGASRRNCNCANCPGLWSKAPPSWSSPISMEPSSM